MVNNIKIDNKLQEQVNKIFEVLGKCLIELNQKVDALIIDNCTDKSLIKHYLNQCLRLDDIQGNFQLLVKLCDYYRSIDPVSADEYMNLYCDFYYKEENEIQR